MGWIETGTEYQHEVTASVVQSPDDDILELEVGWSETGT